MRALLALAVLLPAFAVAQPATVYTSRADFNAAAPGLPLEDFEEATTAPGTFDEVPGPIDSATDNGVFSPGDILPGLSIDVQLTPFSGDVLVTGAGADGAPSVMVGDASQNDVIIRFSPAVNAVGLDVQTRYGSDVDVDALDADGNFLGGPVLENDQLTFVGFTSDTPIAAIRIENGVAWDFARVDNIAFGSPETSTPDVDVEVVSYTTEPERGDFVFVRALVTNHEAAPVQAQIYVEVDVAGGKRRRYNVFTKDLPAGETLAIHRLKRIRIPIPTDATPGVYQARLYAGAGRANGGEVYDVAAFSFRVPIFPSAAPDLPASGVAALVASAPEAGPNPFSTSTSIRYELGADTDVDLRVYDVTGREVAVLASGAQSAGTHSAVFAAGALPGGVYVWRLAIDGDVTTGRVTLAR